MGVIIYRSDFYRLDLEAKAKPYTMNVMFHELYSIEFSTEYENV